MSPHELTPYIRGLGRPAYMPYLTVGDPSLATTVEFACGMIEAGADIIELGIPFSDPTADGPVIQAAMERALEQPDFSLDAVFDVARQIHERHPRTPLVMLTYLNPVLAGFLDPSPENPGARGAFDIAGNLKRFLEQCARAGVRGLVIPDLPHDQPEAALMRELGEQSGVAQILMVAPNTSKRRLKEICGLARGFLYYVTSLGVTGERNTLPENLAERVGLLRERSGVPVFAGFGISRPDQVEPLRSILDGVIVGSLNHRIIESEGHEAGPALFEQTRRFAQVLANESHPA